MGHSFSVDGAGADGPAAPTVVAAGLVSATGFTAEASVEGAAACCAEAGGVAVLPDGDGCAIWPTAFGTGRRAVFGTDTGGRGAFRRSSSDPRRFS